jgi:hypothetical protein
MRLNEQRIDIALVAESGLNWYGSFMTERSAFDEYIFGGGLEAAANKGVADAIAELIAAGITPVYSSTLTQTEPEQNSKEPGELASPSADE